jgi:CheY-like chemotaxis protein
MDAAQSALNPEQVRGSTSPMSRSPVMCAQASPESKRLLVVEDDAQIREALATMLRSEGYGVDVCDNGLRALERLRAGIAPDAIVLDLNMPVMDGWQLRAELRREARWMAIPVVAMSAVDSQASAIEVDAYLRKPFHPRELLVMLQRVLTAAAAARDHGLVLS